jgi:hypothetical protein
MFVSNRHGFSYNNCSTDSEYKLCYTILYFNCDSSKCYINRNRLKYRRDIFLNVWISNK